MHRGLELVDFVDEVVGLLREALRLLESLGVEDANLAVLIERDRRLLGGHGESAKILTPGLYCRAWVVLGLRKEKALRTVGACGVLCGVAAGADFTTGRFVTSAAPLSRCPGEPQACYLRRGCHRSTPRLRYH